MVAEAAGRRGREAFVLAGYRLLGDRGFEGLTVAALCQRVGATKGSFYHHFLDLDGFVEVLAARWRAWSLDLFAGIDAEPDARRRLELCANASFPIMKPGAAAMRAWAGANPVVEAAMIDPHRAGLALSSRAVADHAGDEDTGLVLAATTVVLSIGMLHRHRPVDREHWLQILAEDYRRLGVGGEVRRVHGRPHLVVHRACRTPRPVTAPGDVSGWSIDVPAAKDLSGGGGVARDYFAAAWEGLAREGPEAVTSRALAGRLGLTKGSFVHHFGSMPAFQQALAEDWEQRQFDRLAGCEGERSPRRRLELLLADLLIRPDRAAIVWRAWGHTNPVVGQAIRRVDAGLERALAATLHRLTGDPDVGALAEMTVAFGLGLHRWYPPLAPELVVRVALEWMHRLLGVDAGVSGESGRPTLQLSRA
ncbi:MAG: TetR/AcrR family transcriptional regulator [Sporichthyaceae bacterium]